MATRRGQDVPDPLDVAERFGHLLGAHLEEAVVQPEGHEAFPGGCLALGDLVCVVREDQVDPAGVDVERLAQVPHAHGGAFDVPPGPAGPDGSVPARLACFRALPDGEVADVVLGVLVRLDPLAHPHPRRIDSGQPAVFRPARDPEKVRAVLRPVGMTLQQGSGSTRPAGGCSRSPWA